jgi:16S rRNA C967 or C1407 C5-methylase (RsmB/RsmF family)/NOL1/NOP2/fmu family ribosome biogenesis protein
MLLPETFTVRMRDQLGQECPEFLQALEEVPPVSIRLNPKKAPALFPDSEKVLWHPAGRYLPERPVFTLDPAFHGGAYYVQEASSMFLREALRQTVDLSNRLRVLDLCAAPGGKTTLLASAVSDDSFVLANEVIQSRIPALRMNVEKWGYPNVFLSNHDPVAFQDLEDFFDVVLVDAPCSGEGLFRKSETAVTEWSPENLILCEARQQRILGEAMRLVRAGGVLIYSTCTFNPGENEANVNRMLQTGKFEFLPLKIPASWGVEALKSGYQFYPHRLKGEGFFIACVRKSADDSYSKKNRHAGRSGNWRKLSVKECDFLRDWVALPQSFQFFMNPKSEIVAVPITLLDDFWQMEKALSKHSHGVSVGVLKNKDLIPAHSLALSLVVSGGVSALELEEGQALRFLKKETPGEIGDAKKGWHLACHRGINLGWVKVLDDRLNNYLPKEWRIRMDFPE